MKSSVLRAAAVLLALVLATFSITYAILKSQEPQSEPDQRAVFAGAGYEKDLAMVKTRVGPVFYVSPTTASPEFRGPDGARRRADRIAARLNRFLLKCEKNERIKPVKVEVGHMRGETILSVVDPPEKGIVTVDTHVVQVLRERSRLRNEAPGATQKWTGDLAQDRQRLAEWWRRLLQDYLNLGLGHAPQDTLGTPAGQALNRTYTLARDREPTGLFRIVTLDAAYLDLSEEERITLDEAPERLP